MLFTEKGDKSLPTIILLHGNGLSDWSWDRVVKELQEEYHIVTPIIDGHGEDFETEFTSIEDSADKLIQYIDRYQYGKVFAIGGCTLGAQIVIDILSKRNDIAQYAIIESPLIYPIKLPSSTMNSLSFKVAYKLAKKSWFAKLQAKSLNIPKELYDKFFEDNKKITKTSLINMKVSCGNYTLNSTISDTWAKVLIIVGSKDMCFIKKSAELLYAKIENSNLFVAEGMKQGEFSLLHTEKYIEKVRGLFAS